MLTEVVAFVRASEPAFLAIKVAGAAYLILLGIQSLRAARAHHGTADNDAGTTNQSRPGRLRALRQGVRNDLGNPKMAGFFIGLLPQFAGRGSLAGFLGFGFLFCLLTFGWLTAYSVVVARARKLLDRPRVRRSLDALTATVLIGLGIRLAAEQR
jgi:threonine/homoserine/homoserine lactone efflux protein